MIKQKLSQKQAQKLILAPALQQAIKLLQLTNLELQEIVYDELAENPMLEIEGESGEDPAASAANPEESEEIKSGEENGQEGDNDHDYDDVIFSAGFEDYLDDDIPALSVSSQDEFKFENQVSVSPSLWDHLNWQAALTFFEPAELKIAEYIIGNINEDGYLTVSAEEIAVRLQEDVSLVEEVRSKIKMFDPAGCASLSLKEALLAQMDSLNLQDEVARKIINDYLPLMEKAAHQELASKFNISLAELRFHLDLIKNLDPAPGRKYSEDKTIYVVPDIYVAKEHGEWKVYLNEEGLPRLRLNHYYRQLAQTGVRGDQETARFIKDKMKRALWFIKSIDQRNRTIYRVASYIVSRQKDFLEKGLEALKPMTLMEIGRELGLHESTIGRVVANKYMMTSLGLFPLKFFFHKSLSGIYGEEISSLRIKDRIRKLVQNEDKTNPLSDEEIVDILNRENVQIARRTVAKYRGQLGIPSANIRKKKFLLEEVE
ncbi:MAG: RNA polymerase factor sigma-54 [Acidobacteriota bacterium]|nr:RNA polymerase factor sigma-54 [Acidobacteriota bacterium]